MFCETHFKHSTTEIKDRIQLYQCSLRADGKTLNYFSLIFSFPSHNQTQYAFFLSRGYILSLPQKIAYHSSSRFPVIKYLAMSLINLFLHYISFPRGIVNIAHNTSTMNFNATQANPPCAVPGTFHNYFLCCILGAHFATRSAPHCLPRLAICLASHPGSPSSRDSRYQIP